MSIVVTTDVFCDGVDENGVMCVAWTHGACEGPRPYPGKARHEARKAGWVATRQGDYCPSCAEKFQLILRIKK